MFCNQCGHRNPEGSNFCRSCGAALDAGDDDSATTMTFVPLESQADPSTAEVKVALDEIPEGMGMLVVKRGPNAGSKFVLEGFVTKVGRHPDSDGAGGLDVARVTAGVSDRARPRRDTWRPAGAPSAAGPAAAPVPRG